MTKSSKKKSRNQNRKQLRKQGQTPKKVKNKQKPNRVKTKSVTDFTHALNNVVFKEGQRLIYTKCEFPIVHSKIVDEETNLQKVRKQPLIIKRNGKVTCPRCKKILDNFLVAFRKRRLRPIRNFLYRLSLVKLPKLNIRDKRREKKRLRLMALIEDQALDNFFNSMVKGIKDWRKFVEKHHKERYDEYLSLIYVDEDEDVLLDEEELVFDEDDDISSKTKTEIEQEATDEVEFDNDQEEENIEGQEEVQEKDQEKEDDLEIIDEGEEEQEEEQEEEKKD